MFWKPISEPEPPLAPQLDRFREALAEAFIGEERAGSLSIKADVFRTGSGPWWRRRWIRPRWGFEWLLIHDPDFTERHRHVSYPYDDDAEMETAAFDELLNDSFQLRDRTYSLRWVTRSDAPDLWLEHFGDPT